MLLEQTIDKLNAMKLFALAKSLDRPILLSNLSLDPAVSTWSREPAFLPAVAEILLHLMPRQASETFTVELESIGD